MPGQQGQVELALINTSQSTLGYVLAIHANGACGTMHPAWLGGLPAWGNAPAGATLVHSISLDTRALAVGTYESELCAVAGGIEHRVPLTLVVQADSLPPPAGCGNFVPCDYVEVLHAGGTGAMDVGLVNPTAASLGYVLTAHRGTGCIEPAPAWLVGTPRAGIIPAAAGNTVRLDLDARLASPGYHSASLCLDLGDRRHIASVVLLVEGELLIRDGFEAATLAE